MNESLLPASAAPVPGSASREAGRSARTLRAAGLEPLLFLYVTTLFTSAILLFWVEPLVAKMLLPRLGGSPAVWNTALMFFQFVLLAGYLYAHFVSSRVAPEAQFWVHAAVIVATGEQRSKGEVEQRCRAFRGILSDRARPPWRARRTPSQTAEAARASEWLALARRDADLAFLDKTTPGWKSEHPEKDVAGWTDDFSNLLSVINW